MLVAAASGAMIFTLIGFLLLGWKPGSVAESDAQETAAAAVVEALSTICVQQFQRDPDANKLLKSLAAQSDYGQGTYVEDGGWATMPGDEEPLNGVGKACANILLGS